MLSRCLGAAVRKGQQFLGSLSVLPAAAANWQQFLPFAVGGSGFFSLLGVAKTVEPALFPPLAVKGQEQERLLQ